MIRRISMTALALMVALPLAVSGQDDLRMRVDRSTNPSDPDDVPNVTVTETSDGLRVATGPAVVLWRDGATASGQFTLGATFALEEPSGHTNYYGLIYGGNNLEGERQNYLYFLIGQNGTYIIKHRANNETVHDIVGRTAHEAIQQPTDGQSVNRLEVRVGAEQTEFVINGQVVHAAPMSGMAARTDGIVGIRINHQLPNTVVSNFTITN